MKNQTIGRMIAVHRVAAGYTQQELARVMGVSLRTVCRWEADHRVPPLTKVWRLSKVLDIHADTLGSCWLATGAERADADAATL